MSHVRKDDIVAMPPEDRAKFVDDARHMLPREFRRARITEGHRKGDGWILTIVTRINKVEEIGRRWIAHSSGGRFEVTPS